MTFEETVARCQKSLTDTGVARYLGYTIRPTHRQRYTITGHDIYTTVRGAVRVIRKWVKEWNKVRAEEAEFLDRVNNAPPPKPKPVRIEIYSVDEQIWGGTVIMSREFFNPETKSYLHIEAYQIGNSKSRLPGSNSNLHDGDFMVAFWVPAGNDGDHGFNGSLAHVTKCMQEYVPPDGFVQMKIPEAYYG